jgi:hypothetical protein
MLPIAEVLRIQDSRKTAGILVRPGGRLALIMRRRDFLGFAGGWTFRNRPMRGNLF